MGPAGRPCRVGGATLAVLQAIIRARRSTMPDDVVQLSSDWRVAGLGVHRCMTTSSRAITSSVSISSSNTLIRMEEYVSALVEGLVRWARIFPSHNLDLGGLLLKAGWLQSNAARLQVLDCVGQHLGRRTGHMGCHANNMEGNRQYLHWD